MKLYRIYYDLYYERNHPLAYGTIRMMAESPKDIASRFYEEIKENEEYEGREFCPDRITGIEFHFTIEKDQAKGTEKPRRITYTIKKDTHEE